MKNTIKLLLITFATFSCHAQTISLEQAAACRDNPGTCPDFTYVKDINNSLDRYVGTWKGSYNGKNYEFRFIKKIAAGERIKKDKLIGRLLVTDNAGNIIYNTLNESDDETYLSGLNFVKSNVKTYTLSYVVKGGCYDYGDLYLRSKTSNVNELSLLFIRDSDLIDPSKCNYSTYVTLIPEKIAITLIKQ